MPATLSPDGRQEPLLNPLLAEPFDPGLVLTHGWTVRRSRRRAAEGPAWTIAMSMIVHKVAKYTQVRLCVDLVICLVKPSAVG